MITGPSISRIVACLWWLVGVSAPAGAQLSSALPVDTLWATVHDHRIAFFLVGDTAAPTVILEPGGALHLAWGDLIPGIAEFARGVATDARRAEPARRVTSRRSSRRVGCVGRDHGRSPRVGCGAESAGSSVDGHESRGRATADLDRCAQAMGAAMPNVRHVLVEGAGHAIHRDKPEAVLLALQALLGAVSR